MWKRLQRVGKEACKFQFTVSYQEFTIDCQNAWCPKSICIVWSRRRREEKSESHPLVADPDISQRFITSWNVPENFVAVVTMFRSSNHSRFESKEWTFVVCEEGAPLAMQTLNLSDYAEHTPSQVQIDLPLKSKHKSIMSATLHFTMSCAFIKQGKATDDDLLSISSLMSMEKTQSEQFTRSHSERWTRGRGLDKKRRSLGGPSSSRHHPGLHGDGDVSNNLAKRYNLAQYLQDYELTRGIEETIKEEQTPSILPCTTIERPAVDRYLTATQTLMTWCQEVTKGYPKINIQDMTISWKNGLAFCAIFHHYRPDLIDFESLDPSDVIGNCRLAFKAGESLGIPRVIEPTDMVQLQVPDKLSIMTYLFQLKTYFTDSLNPAHNNSLRADLKKTISDRNKLDNRSPSPYSANSTLAPSLERNYNKMVDLLRCTSSATQPSFYPMGRDVSSVVVKELSSSKNSKMTLQHPDRVANHVSVSQNSPQHPGHLMTRRQLLNPFDSDDEEEDVKSDTKLVNASTIPDLRHPIDSQQQSSTSSQSFQDTTALNDADLSHSCLQADDPVPPPRPNRARSRYDELKEEARLKIADVRRKDSSASIHDQQFSEKEQERQRMLHERAKLIIAETKSSKSMMEIIGAIYDSPQSLRASLRRGQNLFQAPSNEPNYFFNLAEDDEITDKELYSDAKSSDNLQGDVPKKEVSNLPCSFSSEGENEGGAMRSLYVTSEMDDLEREQTEVDVKAANLEWELRRIMKMGNAKDLEEEKLQEWFGLVNRKNALIRRQMQLNLLEKERDLEKRFNLLSIELRKVMSEPDWSKTDELRCRETMLLAELMELVDKRDELIQSMDSQERAIEDDEKTETTVVQRLSEKKKRNRKRVQMASKSNNNGLSPSADQGSTKGCALQ